jgi:hypothetical protein
MRKESIRDKPQASSSEQKGDRGAGTVYKLNLSKLIPRSLALENSRAAKLVGAESDLTLPS